MFTPEEWKKDGQCMQKGFITCALTPGCKWNHNFNRCFIKAGGGIIQSRVKYNNKIRKVNVDNQGHRYIRMGGEIVYLKTIRGQYRYV